MFKSILNSLKSNDLTITLADKNIGIVVINTSLYNNLCAEHLSDDLTYTKIDFNPQYKIFSDAKFCLRDLNNKGHITNSLFKTLFSKIHNKKLAKFGILVKLHKPNKFGIRPLINCSNTTLSPISKLIDFYLKPIMSSHFSFIKDS